MNDWITNKKTVASMHATVFFVYRSPEMNIIMMAKGAT